MTNLYDPEGVDIDAIERDAIIHMIGIMELFNSNKIPETGTVGFIFGTTFALGNIISAYTQFMPPEALAELLEIVAANIKYAAENPSTTRVSVQ